MKVHTPCRLLAVLAASLPLSGVGADVPEAPDAPTVASVLEAAQPSDWRTPDPEQLLYLDIGGRRVVIELAPQFAPRHVANIQALARQHYWDGLAIVRVQENYVVQWGDPDAGDPALARSLGAASASLPAEFVRAATALPFTRLPDGDVYAPQVGWSHGFPTARSSATGEAWLAHCHGMVGAGRDNAADSSNGSELYVVSGHSPRHLDRNITVVGRVLQGIEVLTALPRGTGAMGFHEDAAQRVAIETIRLASELPEAARIPLQVLRTDTQTFRQLVEARRNRREPWFIEPTGTVELCNVPLPVRRVP
jgi:peptidylprolyl isomerase